MADKVEIQKPAENDHVGLTVPCSGTVKLVDASEFGLVTAEGTIEVKDPDSGKLLCKKTVEGSIQQTGATNTGTWEITFQGLLYEGAGTITVVTKHGDNPGSSPERSVTIKKTKEDEAAGKTNGWDGCQITITSPAAGAHVGPPFSAYGTASGCTSIAGTLTYGGQTWNGTTAAQPPNWQINFSQPCGPLQATLKIVCTQDPTCFAQETINLNPCT